MNEFEALEQKYKVNDYHGNEGNSIYFIDSKMYPRLLISAPHSVKQRRCGKVKPHEFYTGAIAERLASELQCACITKGSLSSNTEDDANYQMQCEYKDTVSRYVEENSTIKLFVDIHGLSSGRKDTVIDICTNNERNILCNGSDNRLIEVLKTHGFPESMIGLNRYYDASPVHTMSRWLCDTYCIPAIELEISGAYRWFEGECYEQSLKMYNCLLEWLKAEQLLIDGTSLT